MTEPTVPRARSVLVTGASGLVGRQVVARLAALAQAGDSVRSVVALDLREPPPSARVAGVEYVEGDVRDPALEKELATRDVDSIVHLAAVVTPGPDSSRELEYSIDVLGTENVIECVPSSSVSLIGVEPFSDPSTQTLATGEHVMSTFPWPPPPHAMSPAATSTTPR